MNMSDDIIISFGNDPHVESTDETRSLVEVKKFNSRNKIFNWLAPNKFLLNIDRTVFLAFGNYSHSILSSLNITMNERPLKGVESNK